MVRCPYTHAERQLTVPGVSEEQIMEIFGRCGTVVSFRLVYDKDTGRPKGFGFLEYTTADAAASAVRNLNEHEIGGRTLRVDYSNDNDKGGRPAQDGPAEGGALPPLPAGIEVAPGITAPDAISKTISAIPPPQLLDIMSQMKGLVTTDPQQATAILTQAPQLGYALFQALLLLGLVDTNVLGSLVATTQNAPPPQSQPPPPQQMPMGMPPPQYQQQMPAGFTPMQQPQYGQPGFGPPQYATPPPVQQYQPPPMQQPVAALPPGVDPALLDTVRNLTRDQILSLDEASRQQIIQLRMAMSLPPVPA